MHAKSVHCNSRAQCVLSASQLNTPPSSGSCRLQPLAQSVHVLPMSVPFPTSHCSVCTADQQAAAARLMHTSICPSCSANPHCGPHISLDLDCLPVQDRDGPIDKPKTVADIRKEPYDLPAKWGQYD